MQVKRSCCDLSDESFAERELLRLVFIQENLTDGSDPQSAGAAALSWLLEERRSDGGWGDGTAAAVIALNLADGSGPGRTSGLSRTSGLTRDSGLGRTSGLSRTEHQLAEKQLQIELLAAIWRQHQSPVTPVRLAEYVTALVSSCVDVTRFQGKDLTGGSTGH
ncbi:uncharacterized protein FJT64_024836 [Amphibalanus amphitrite]|uniref:Uncharacterized protein n=1 Tax=Amphibalanus amphitrite TaxID=1232801 RepID=A0A6A4W5P7_AMPAM|nr:uncharacterized protein FJT64_024836 [Amphibalanus amphitrite]